jgi:excisionase family DNA binding protein
MRTTGRGRTGVVAVAGQGATPGLSSAPLLDVESAAARLGTPTRFVRRLVSERRVRFYKVGRYVRFDPDDLDAWVEANCVEPRRG